MNKLAQSLIEESNVTTTENGAKTYKSSLSAVLDFYSQGAAYRRNPGSKDLEKIFQKAYLENEILALKTLFYIRDVREGQGEREIFRTLINFLAKTYPDRLAANIPLIPFFGRWDDIFALMETKLEDLVYALISDQLKEDLKSERPSLMAKWLPSENSSSKVSKARALKLRKVLEMSSKQYRQTLSTLRKRINVLERQMCAQEWKNIEYSSVPSNASALYRKAFRKHDEERYTKFLADVKAGKSKINAKTLMPHEIIRNAQYSKDETLEALWKALPNMLPNDDPVLVLSDVSGSMMGLPMEVSLALGLYISERTRGPFHNVFMTFSADPEIIHIKGNSLHEKIQYMKGTRFGLNTNFQACFDKLLQVAIENNCSQEDMPKTLYVVSDMQFDQADGTQSYAFSREVRREGTNFEVAKAKFEAAGYKFPDIVFHNVRAGASQSPVKKDERGVFLVSGFSPNILKYALEKRELTETPLDLMMRVLESERYSVIK